MLIRSIILLLICYNGYGQQRPNIIYIMSDDHDADAISAYNKTLINTPNIDRIAKEGMRFTNSYVANSICSPVRATILTGQHSHKNGIKTNRIRFDSSRITVPKILKEAGYQTAIIGKWHLHSLPTGFDHWKIYPGQGAYHSPRLVNMNNDTVRYDGYSTSIITNEVIQWLDTRDKSKPFFLMVHHKAPHRNFIPDLKWLEVFSRRRIPEPRSLYADTIGRGTAYRHQRMSILNDMTLCTDLKIDPMYLKGIPHLQPDSVEIRNYNFLMNSIPEYKRNRMKEIFALRGELLRKNRPSGNELLKLKYQWYMQDFLACVASVDESVGAILKYLDTNQLTDNTALFYTSDQGFYLGENGWFDKRFMYDASMQIPLLIKWKGHIRAGSVTNELVQNIDFASTFLDIAGVQPPAFMQGISLKPLLTGRQYTLSRKELYYHYYEYPIDHYVLPHLGIREQQYKLIYFYTVNEWEFYDLKRDPFEKKNLIRSYPHQEKISTLKRRLKEVRKEYGDTEPVGILK